MDRRACSPCPHPELYTATTTSQDSDPDHGSAVIATADRLWDIKSGEKLTITYKFLNAASGFTNRIAEVDRCTKIWEKYANVEFKKMNAAGSDAMIRIGFDIGGSWSAIGKDAEKITDNNKPTLNLGWIKETMTKFDTGTILHELGHALGMMHEHQSPARGERIHLKLLEVYRYYRPLLNNDDSLVKSQVVDPFNLSQVSNYSHLDLQSIMMYFMDGSLNEEGLTIPANNELSKLDKAFITLTYPQGDEAALANTDDPMTVSDALVAIGEIPDDVAGRILTHLATEDWPSIRTEFATYNKRVMDLSIANRNFLMTVNPTTGDQHGIRNSMSALIGKSGLFKGIVKNIVNNIFKQNGITTANTIAGGSESEVLNAIGAIATSPEFADTISDLNTYFSGIPPQPASSSSPTASA